MNGILRGTAIVALLAVACGGSEPGPSPSTTAVLRETTANLRPKARVQVSVKASAEEPTPDDLALRKTLEDRIEQENVGRLVSSSSGGGYFDVVVEVESTADAIPRIQQILRSLEVAPRASFKVIPK